MWIDRAVIPFNLRQPLPRSWFNNEYYEGVPDLQEGRSLVLGRQAGGEQWTKHKIVLCHYKSSGKGLVRLKAKEGTKKKIYIYFWQREGKNLSDIHFDFSNIMHKLIYMMKSLLL